MPHLPGNALVSPAMNSGPQAHHLRFRLVRQRSPCDGALYTQARGTSFVRTNFYLCHSGMLVGIPTFLRFLQKFPIFSYFVRKFDLILSYFFRVILFDRYPTKYNQLVTSYHSLSYFIIIIQSFTFQSTE